MITGWQLAGCGRETPNLEAPLPPQSNVLGTGWRQLGLSPPTSSPLAPTPLCLQQEAAEKAQAEADKHKANAAANKAE